MRILSIYLILLSIGISFAQDITWEGQVWEYQTNIPMANAKIVFTRIGDEDTTHDTITTKSNGTYTWTYPFELIKYKRKYNIIKFRGIDTETHWYYNRTYHDYPNQDMSNIDMIAIPETLPKIYTLSGKVSPQGFLSQPMPGIDLLCSRISEDGTEIKDTVISTDMNGYYSVPIQNNKNYRYNILIKSETWQDKLLDNSRTKIVVSPFFYDHTINFNVNTVDTASTDWIRISGKLITNSSPSASIYLNDYQTTSSDGTTGKYVCFVSKGWSGTVSVEKFGYECSPPIEITNIQSDQIINFTGTRKMYTVSGHVYIEDGDSIDFVLLNKAVTDSNGFYSIEVPYHNILKLIPTKKGYSFTPDSTQFWNITNDITMDIFATVEEQINVEGTVSNGTRGGVDGVIINFSGKNGQCISNTDGSFTHPLRLEWSGTITPQKEGCTFEPAALYVERMSEDTTIIFICNLPTQTNIITKPVTIKLIKPQIYETQIFNPAGRRVNKILNTPVTEMLMQNAAGMYIYQKFIKDMPVKTQQMLFMK